MGFCCFGIFQNCLCLPSTGNKGVHHPHLAQFRILKKLRSHDSCLGFSGFAHEHSEFRSRGSVLGRVPTGPRVKLRLAGQAASNWQQEPSLTPSCQICSRLPTLKKCPRVSRPCPKPTVTLEGTVDPQSGAAVNDSKLYAGISQETL